jgi:hypothetical protein
MTEYRMHHLMRYVVNRGVSRAVGIYIDLTYVDDFSKRFRIAADYFDCNVVFMKTVHITNVDLFVRRVFTRCHHQWDDVNAIMNSHCFRFVLLFIYQLAPKRLLKWIMYNHLQRTPHE